MFKTTGLEECRDYLNAHLSGKIGGLSYISGGDQLAIEIGNNISKGREYIGEYRLLTQDANWELSTQGIILFSRESLPQKEELKILKDIMITSIELDKEYKLILGLERSLQLVLYSWRDGDLWDLWNENTILTLTTKEGITQSYISPSNLPNYLLRQEEEIE